MLFHEFHCAYLLSAMARGSMQLIIVLLSDAFFLVTLDYRGLFRLSFLLIELL